MLKKPSRKNNVVVDVPADDPVGTLDRFTDGLRRVLAIPKAKVMRAQKRRRKHHRKAGGRRSA